MPEKSIVYSLIAFDLKTTEYQPRIVDMKVFECIEDINSYADRIHQQKIHEGYVDGWSNNVGDTQTLQLIKAIENQDETYGLVHFIVCTKQTIQ